MLIAYAERGPASLFIDEERTGSRRRSGEDRDLLLHLFAVFGIAMFVALPAKRKGRALLALWTMHQVKYRAIRSLELDISSVSTFKTLG